MVLGNSEKSPAAVTAPTARWGIIFSVLALLLAGAHMSNPIRIDSTVILLCLLAIAPWVLPFLLPLLRRYVRSIEAFGAKVEFIESKLAYESRRLDDLYFLSIGDKLLLHLRKLQQPGGYGPFYVGTALPREFEHLENLGYIRFRAPLKGLDDFLTNFTNAHGANLSDHVELTDIGKLFLKLLQESQPRQEAL